MLQKTKLLRDSLEAELCNAVNIPYRYKKVPATVRPPFGAYLLDLVRVDGVIEVYDFTVEIADYDSNSSHLDELADKIAKHMNGLAVLDDNQTWESYLSSRFSIDEDDKNIQRIRLSFAVRYVPRMEE